MLARSSAWRRPRGGRLGFAENDSMQLVVFVFMGTLDAWHSIPTLNKLGGQGDFDPWDSLLWHFPLGGGLDTLPPTKMEPDARSGGSGFGSCSFHRARTSPSPLPLKLPFAEKDICLICCWF